MAWLLKGGAGLGFHWLIYLGLALVCSVSAFSGCRIIRTRCQQCLGGMFTPGANKNYQTFTPISLIGFQGGGRGV